jgi:hypothetical protein
MSSYIHVCLPFILPYIPSIFPMFITLRHALVSLDLVGTQLDIDLRSMKVVDFHTRLRLANGVRSILDPQDLSTVIPRNKSCGIFDKSYPLPLSSVIMIRWAFLWRSKLL